MVYSSEAEWNILFIGTIFLLWLSGAVITVISFIAHRDLHPKAAVVLAFIGYGLKLPVYILGAASLPDIIYRGDILMLLTLAVILIAAAGYTVHMIMFAVKDRKIKNNSEEQNG